MKKILSVVVSLLLCTLLMVGLSSCTLYLTEYGLPGPGSTVYFGVWGESGSMTPISWTVLNKTDEQVTMISTYIIDAKVFDDSAQPFASSDIKTWLEGTFLSGAFTSAEQNAITGSPTLLSAADAASLFGTDAARTSTATAFAVTAGCTGDMWWLSDDAGSTANAAMVDGAGAIDSTTGTVKTDTSIGVRPVITVDADAVALVVGATEASDFSSFTEHQMNLTQDSGSSYVLTVYDSAFPTLTVTDYTLEDDVLTVSCSTSAALTGSQKIFCYLQVTGGIAGGLSLDCFGWSSLTDGEATFTGFDPSYQYKAILAVGEPAAGDYYTCYAGAADVIDVVDYLAITGIEENEHFEAGESVAFGATGYKLSVASPESDEYRWVPASWSVSTASGTWSGSPYTSSFTLPTDGSYTLTVNYTCESYSITTSSWEESTSMTEDQTRSVSFVLDKAVEFTSSDADGKIYTGGRITLTPSVQNGTWSFDGTYLSQDGFSFTALKAGTTTVTYTVGAYSESYVITIQQSGLPNTGQDFSWVWLLCGLALALAAAGISGVRKRKKANMPL